MNLRRVFFVVGLFVGLGVQAAEPIRVLIVDGRNNHNWIVTTDALRATLQATGRFQVTVSTVPESLTVDGPREPRSENPAIQARFQKAKTLYTRLVAPARKREAEAWQQWRPDFAAHDCVILNYNGPMWPESVQQAFVKYVHGGGGVLLIHGANNAFPNWDAFNDIIGMGWRKAPFGQAIKVDANTGKPFADPQAGNSSHGSKHAFAVTVRAPEHPVMRDVPPVWLHARDELYHHMRGPAKNLTVLSSAFSDPKQRGTGQHEPITWEVAYGQGRTIVTSMGHFYKGDSIWDALYCVGFQTIVARSCEYLATDKVTLPIPEGFPGLDEPSLSPPHQMSWTQSEPNTLAKARAEANRKNAANPYCVLTPEEELATFDLAPGFVAELVAAEPQIEEPVLTVWDANGALYIAEMRSYMQDENGNGTKTLRNGRIKRLEDTDGDGRMDRVTTFVKDLNLPRMILPLDDWIAVRETDTMDVIAYRDTNGDGVADEKKPLFEYGPRSRNGPNTSVEHQDSGLVWNLDNWIYITYNMERYRFTDGTWRPQSQPGHWTQWGLTHDNAGRLFWIDNTHPLKAAQMHPKYWLTPRRLSKKLPAGDLVTLGNPYTPAFMNVESLCLLNDRGGPAAKVRAFTSACGQSVFRGDKLPLAARGDYFFCDPTIHVVRRAKVGFEQGKLMLTKAEPGTAEFLRSPDINSRFVNTATGPDGTLYVTDMYRGIIQDAPWMNPNARKFAAESGLAANRLRGRIWRIRHRDFEPGPRPRMLQETTTELVRHLQHAKGWWRDTAQRLILLRPDRKTVIPLLESTAMFTQNPLGRLHALWTLEGMNAVSDAVLDSLITDRQPLLRTAAIQVAEGNLEAHLDRLKPLKAERDPRVVEQLVLTLGTVDHPAAEALIQEVAQRHIADRGVMQAVTVSLWGKKDQPLPKAVANGSAFAKLPVSSRTTVSANWKGVLANWDRGLNFPESMPNEMRKYITSGERQYYQHCITCHGPDGKGVPVLGTNLQLAPSLADSKRVGGDPAQLIPAMLHGLTGPIEGKTYAGGFMAPAGSLGITRDDRLAELLSYIRFAWGRKASVITKDEVNRVRKQYQTRTTPWTDVELKQLKP